MSYPDRILLLGLGEVGRVLAAGMSRTEGLRLRAWDRAFADSGSTASGNLSRFPMLTAARCAEEAAAGCGLVVSAVTAGQAQAALASVMPALSPGAWYLDLNSVAPRCKQEMVTQCEASGVRFVEAAIMSPIEPRHMASPVLLAGPYAAHFLDLARTLGFDNVSVASDRYGQAAATKLCRSIVVKGIEALVGEALLTARHFGVEESVLASLSDLFPRDDWEAFARYVIGRSLLHGKRRAEEMREAADMVNEAGFRPRMSSACAEHQAWASRYRHAREAETLATLLDTLASTRTPEEHPPA